MIKEVTPAPPEDRCLECRSNNVSTYIRNFVYQVIDRRRILAAENLWIESTICFGCKKTFISKKGLPPNFIQGLAEGSLKLHNPTETKVITITDKSLSYIPYTQTP